MLFLFSEEGVWPLTASKTSQVKNNYVHVTMTGILNKISDVKFTAGCRQTISNSTTIKNINKI